MSLGKRLAKARKQAGMTQEALAEATGLTRPHIQKIESDVHSPTVATLEALIKPCGLSLAQFFESRIPADYEDPTIENCTKIFRRSSRPMAIIFESIRLVIDAIHDKLPSSPNKQPSRK